MKKTMYAMILFGIVIFAACNTPQKETEPAEKTQAELIERGAYLVNIMDCNVCHSPKIMTDKGPAPDTQRMLSGHPSNMPLLPFDTVTAAGYVLAGQMLTVWIGPWGISYAANLTPHETGLGNWTEERFIQAFRNGKHLGLDNQRPIMPPMPVAALAALPDEDLKALFAYLQSIPPVENVVPAYAPPSVPGM